MGVEGGNVTPCSCLRPYSLTYLAYGVQMGKKGTALTGCPNHSCFEDFTFDKSETMSGAADDYAYG